MAQDVTPLVKDFILREFLPDEDPDNLTPTTPLMSSGILDSVGALKLITFLEQELNVQIEAHEIDRENLETLQAIASLVGSKRRG